jgi:hypothetical protein
VRNAGARAPARGEHIQGVRGREYLPAPAPKGHMQRVRGRVHLRAQARTSARGAYARSVGARARAPEQM